jgi:hypothetical protein
MASSVTVDFNANLARFTSGIDKATNDLNRFQTNAERISGNISKAFGALGVGISVGAFSALIKSSIDAQDRLLDLSKTTRLSVEELSGLSFAAKTSGSDLDGTAKAINKLAVEMGKDAEKFKLLGITAKNPLEAFGQLADAMNAIEDPQQRAAVGAAALGKSWETAAPLMAEGGRIIREMIEEGRRLSGATDAGAKAADEFNTKWEAIKTRGGGWFTTVVANPIVSGLLAISDSMYQLEIAGGPGSVFNLLFGKGPQKKALGATGSWDAPAPTSENVKGFIGGGDKAGGKSGATGKTPLQRMIELGQRNLAASSFGADESGMSVGDRMRIDAAALEERARAMDEMAMARMEMYRIETEGEGAVQEAMRQTNTAIKETDSFARDLGLTFSSAFEDAVIGGKKFSDVLRSLAEDVGRMILRKTVTQPLADSVGGFLDGIFNGLLPKYAQGTPWVPNDGPAYLHKGEQVIPAGKSGGGGGITVNIIGAQSQPQVRQRSNSSGGLTLDVIFEQVDSFIAGGIASGRGATADALGNTYGLNRAAGAF